MTGRVVVFGGSGVFGKRVVREILRLCDAPVTVVARDRGRAEKTLAGLDLGRIALRPGDASYREFVRESIRGARAAVCCIGPFSRLDTTILDACIAERVHYVDIAENREYVGRVFALGDRIKEAGIVALTGHSSLPGTSSLLAKVASQGMPQVDEVVVGLFLGNKNERGRGGIGALLHSLGEEFMGWEDGRDVPLVGWHMSRLFSFPEPVGERELFISNIADYEQLPRLLGARTARFFVGFESRVMNRLIHLAGRLKRIGLVPSGPRTASALVRFGGIFALTGYDGGAIQVSVLGKDSAEKQVRRTVTVMADREGQRIPAMPAALGACALARGEIDKPGVFLFGEWMDPGRYLADLESQGFRVLV